MATDDRVLFAFCTTYPNSASLEVGSTIYPGMQFTAVYLKNYVFGDSMSLNDICCYIPAWFGVMATVLVGFITYEATLPVNTGGSIFGVLLSALRGQYADDKSMASSGSTSRIFGLSSPAVESAVFAMGFMAVVPAHLMRSVGGGYDNESVAVTAMTLTFYLWMRSLRGQDQYGYLFGFLAGVAYFYMVSSPPPCNFAFHISKTKLTVDKGGRLGRLHFRVKLDRSTRGISGSPGAFLDQGLPVVYPVLRRRNIVGDSSACRWMGAVEIT